MPGKILHPLTGDGLARTPPTADSSWLRMKELAMPHFPRSEIILALGRPHLRSAISPSLSGGRG
jgi:hypothetical protein